MKNPRVDLTRFYGVFAPNSKHRALVTPSKRGKGNHRASSSDSGAPTPTEHRASMTCAQRFKRVFSIDIQTCRACGGAPRFIACIEDPLVIEKILIHLDDKGNSAQASRLPSFWAPPKAGLFD